MPHQRSRRSFRGRSRPTTWEQIPNDFAMGVGIVEQVLDLSNSQIINNTSSGGTCIRMIGEVTVEHAAKAAANEIVNLGIGIAVVTKDGLLAGEVPDPQATTDQNQDWYFWTTIDRTLGPAGANSGQIKVPIDIKTSRRLRGGYRLAMVFQKQLSELGYEVHVSMRLLWRLLG